MNRKLIMVLAAVLMIPAITFAQLNKFEKTYRLIQFDKLDISGHYQVFITEGTDYSVRIVNDSAINAKEASVVVTEKKGKLSINYVGNSMESRGVNIHLNMPAISEIKLDEEVKVFVDDLKIGDIKITMRDKSKLNGMLVTQAVTANLRGSAEVKLKGAGSSLKLRIRDNAIFLGENMKFREVDIKQQGTANISVNASNGLKINAKGVGEIRYVGSPSDLSLKKSGVVNINQVK